MCIRDRRGTAPRAARRPAGWAWDRARGRIYWSHWMYEVLGLPPEDRYMSFGELQKMVYPGDADLQSMAEALAANEIQTFDCEFRVRNAREEWIWIRARGEAVESAPAEGRRLIGIAVDITDALGDGSGDKSGDGGGEAVIVGSVADDCTELRQRLTRSALDVDLVLTAGGISAGAYEVVKQACEGWDIEFDVVQMRQGAPQGCGWLPGGPDRRVPLVAVPGNPVAVFVSFHVFVRPLLTLMSGGDPESVPGTVAAISNGGLRSRVDKRQFTPVLVTLDDEQGGLTTLSLPGGTGSHRIATLHQANGLAVIAEELAEIAPGEAVPVLSLIHI